MLLPFSFQENTPVEETFEEVRRMLEVRSAEIRDNIANTRLRKLLWSMEVKDIDDPVILTNKSSLCKVKFMRTNL